MCIRALARWSAPPFVLFATFATAANGQNSDEHPRKVETVTVTASRNARAYQPPAKSESITAADAAVRINAANTEDMLKYLPNILVRKRHIGDTQDPVTTRTSGVGSSARSLIYADGILLSSLIANNNTTGSPHWGLVAPEEVDRIDVLYGPFAAQYPGNSIGAVVEIATRMPGRFEMNAKAQGAVQSFSQYGTKNDYGTWQIGGGMGDRDGAFSWRIGVNHLDSHGQPLSYVTLTRPPSPLAGGTAVTGAFDTLNRTAAPVIVAGTGGIEHQVQDNATLKLAYEFSDTLRAAYTLAVFRQDDDATAETYLRDGAGNPVYSGTINFGGYRYSVGASSFSNGVYNLKQTHLAHALSLRSDGDAWEWEGVFTLYDYAQDKQRIPGAALPGGFDGGMGTITRMDGTGWYTADLRAVWHADAGNDLSFGAHYDHETLKSLKYNTADWKHGREGAPATASRGKTHTAALWAQDVWRFAPQWKATLGLRYEDWNASGGLNYSLAPPQNVAQPKQSGSFFSPKASLAWQPDAAWTLTASYGRAYRMPTVSELYQSVTTGLVLSSPDPNLKPERAESFELSAERLFDDGRVRLSLFQESIVHALISQSGLLGGSTVNFVQNIDRVRSHGAELVFGFDDVLVDGLSLSGSATYVDPQIRRDPVLPAAEGKQIPQVPKWRWTALAIYAPDDQWSFTLAARYSDRVYATIDNVDGFTHTWQGFDGYFVMDARARYAFDTNWSASVGIDNLNNRKYFLFHPFPQRTLLVELKYAQ